MFCFDSNYDNIIDLSDAHLPSSPACCRCTGTFWPRFGNDARWIFRPKARGSVCPACQGVAERIRRGCDCVCIADCLWGLWNGWTLHTKGPAGAWGVWHPCCHAATGWTTLQSCYLSTHCQTETTSLFVPSRLIRHSTIFFSWGHIHCRRMHDMTYRC